jgi:hypothetical protein
MPLGGGADTAAASPYVVAMNNLGVGVLPHITNALPNFLVSKFSALSNSDVMPFCDWWVGLPCCLVVPPGEPQSDRLVSTSK